MWDLFFELHLLTSFLKEAGSDAFVAWAWMDMDIRGWADFLWTCVRVGNESPVRYMPSSLVSIGIYHLSVA